MAELNKQPKYVKVYNQLLALIEIGIYPKESKLPSELQLAKKLGVSRMTLRQGLNLLQEDGLIEIKHGLGSFVTGEGTPINEGLERQGQVLDKLTATSFELVSCALNLRPADHYIDKHFHQRTGQVLDVRRLFQGEKGQAYCFTVVAGPEFESLYPDLTEERIHDWLEEDLYQHSVSSHLHFQVLEETHVLKEQGLTSQFHCVGLVTEKVFGQTGQLLAIHKYYLPVEWISWDVLAKTGY